MDASSKEVTSELALLTRDGFMRAYAERWPVSYVLMNAMLMLGARAVFDPLFAWGFGWRIEGLGSRILGALLFGVLMLGWMRSRERRPVGRRFIPENGDMP